MCFIWNSELKKNIGKIKFFSIFYCYINSLFQDFNQEKSTKISILMPPVFGKTVKLDTSMVTNPKTNWSPNYTDLTKLCLKHFPSYFHTPHWFKLSKCFEKISKKIKFLRKYRKIKFWTNHYKIVLKAFLNKF